MTFKNYFLTTTLPYANSTPHIGHAFEFIIGDAISRHLRKNNNVYFNIGIDEHGLKIWERANEVGKTPIDFCDSIKERWIDFCDLFKIEYDNFYRTSDKTHHEGVSIIWDKLLENGDIYKKNYSGQYCKGCESFKLEKELVDGTCPDHPHLKLEYTEEENYFFKITNYTDQLISWLDSNPHVLKPNKKINELRNLLLDYEDISISRKKENCPWGVAVPNDDAHIIHVWMDALCNYLLSAGYLTDNFNWDNVIQICGPDNIRFQGGFFQAILVANNIKNADTLIVHGTILDKDGRKMSKSLGNTIDPIDQVQKYGIEAVRYYSLTGLSIYDNSDWNEDSLISVYNNELCNDWGNLVARTLHLSDVKGSNPKPEDSFKEYVDREVEQITNLWGEFKLRDALIQTNLLVKYGNKYINDRQPWKLDTFKETLGNLIYLIEQVNELYQPVIPDSCERVKKGLSENKKIIIFDKIK